MVWGSVQHGGLSVAQEKTTPSVRALACLSTSRWSPTWASAGPPTSLLLKGGCPCTIFRCSSGGRTRSTRCSDGSCPHGRSAPRPELPDRNSHDISPNADRGAVGPELY